MAQPTLPSVDEPAANANTLFAWLNEQPDTQAKILAESLFEQLVERSSKSRSSSVNACTKLCGFVQHCARSDKEPIRAWAFQESTAERLFHFYIEWNEKDQHRSMKLVLDILAYLITQNPGQEVRASIRSHILTTLVSILSHKSTRPLVKSSIASLSHLLSKSVYTFDDVAQAYSQERETNGAEEAATLPPLALWQRFVHDMFGWMTLHYVCPAAGKLLVSVFIYLRTCSAPARDTDSSITHSSLSGFTTDLWLEWLRDGLVAYPGILEDVKLYFFIPLFKADRASSLLLLEALNKQQPAEASSAFGPGAVLQLSVLEVGKKAGLVDDPGLNLSGKPTKGILLNENVLDNVLAGASHNVQSLALSLLVSSQSTTKPFSPTAFDLLRKYLPGYHAESDAKFRYEMLGHTRDMATRLKSAIATMQKRLQTGTPGKAQANGKAAAPTVSDNAIKDALAQHEAFLAWYMAFLCDDLAPTASYQRHFASLKATSSLLRMRRDISGGMSDALDTAFAKRLFHNDTWIRCVLDLIMDPFDDVRDTATSLLALAPREFVTLSRITSLNGMETASLWHVLVEFSQRADELASRTARADHADGAAHTKGLLCSWADGLAAQKQILNHVLDRLESKIDRAEEDLGTAAVKYPVHGEFASIRYIWDVLARTKYSPEQLQELGGVQTRIVNNCTRIWHIVKHVLCDDSPEGHLPEDMEDVTGLDSKNLLSYSFRSISESSNTLRAIVSHLRFSRVAGMLCPSRSVFEAIGNLSFEQLASLRHRGALSTVSQTFTLCCQQAQDPLVADADRPEDKTLLMQWYKGTLDCIQSQVSTTRRSAGIPGLFSGILASNATKPSFEEAIRTACEIAQQPAHVRETDGSRLPQVHALNCLRDVFRSSLLSKRAERLLPDCLQLAANMLRSEVWAIRNCGLLLLRSLIDCLFGTGDSKASLESGWDGRTIRISYNKYPTLPGVLLRLLHPGNMAAPNTTEQASQIASQIESQQAAAESVFPALDILRRAGPPETGRDELYDAVSFHLGSRLWHVREMAARTICSFLVGQQDWLAGIDTLVNNDKCFKSANILHGTLLAVRFVLGRIHDTAKDDLLAKFPQVIALLDGLEEKTPLFWSVPDIEAAYMEVVNTAFALGGHPGSKLGCGTACYDDDASKSTPPVTASMALLRAQKSIHETYVRRETQDFGGLLDTLVYTAVYDPDTAMRLLEVVQEQEWRDIADGSHHLVYLYTEVARKTATPEVRAQALLGLADAIDSVLQSKDDAAQQVSKSVIGAKQFTIPSIADQMVALWPILSQGQINPILSCAVIRSSGPIVSAIMLSKWNSTAQASADEDLITTDALVQYAAMMLSAGEASQTFDTRMAAVLSLKSFVLSLVRVSSVAEADSTITLWGELPENGRLPIAFCIYDCLNDDDDEIRTVAAETASTLLTRTEPGKLPLSLDTAEAARRLPVWMAATFGHLALFGAEVQARMTGQLVEMPPSTVSSWPKVGALLRTALQTDDALFLVEEQNLFIDEVRESRRWADIAVSKSVGAGDADKKQLAVWLEDGLDVLSEHVSGLEKHVDGPLGWTSTPAVFALCARVLLGSRAILATTKASRMELASKLAEFHKKGQQAHVHGLLLKMAEWEEISKTEES